jgi:hypothetical protein
MENIMSKVHTVDEQAIEATCKVEWERDPKLRAEFNNSLADYIAFKRAEVRGSVWIKPSSTLPG